MCDTLEQPTWCQTLKSRGSHLLPQLMSSGDGEIALDLYPHGSRSSRTKMSRPFKGKNREQDIPEDQVGLLQDTREDIPSSSGAQVCGNYTFYGPD